MSENNLDAALREIADLRRTIERLDDIRQSHETRIKALERQAMRSGSQVVTMRPQIQPHYRTLGQKLGD